MSPDASWLDANVLLRFLTGEPEEMANSAERLLEKAQRGELTLRVHPITVAETVWVLKSYYGHSRSEITRSLAPLLRDGGLAIEDAEVVLDALEAMAEKTWTSPTRSSRKKRSPGKRASPPSTGTSESWMLSVWSRARSFHRRG